MRIPFEKITDAARMGASAQRESDVPVRVAVYVDATATPFLIDTVRAAFVPQTTSAILRVERLGEGAPSIKQDTDIALVLSCGGDRLEAAVQGIIVGGAPVAVIAESSVEVPFIERDTRMLGLIAATDAGHLLRALSAWILERTEKRTAFAANFPFMRDEAAKRAIASCALANMATGALVFIPGADYPVMALAQVGMAFELAAIYGRPLRPERGYEVAGVLVAGLALRAGARVAARRAGRLGFAVKALVAAGGTYGMGRALAAVHGSGVDYAAANEALGRAASTARSLATRLAAGDGPATAGRAA